MMGNYSDATEKAKSLITREFVDVLEQVYWHIGVYYYDDDLEAFVRACKKMLEEKEAGQSLRGDLPHR